MENYTNAGGYHHHHGDELYASTYFTNGGRHWRATSRSGFYYAHDGHAIGHLIAHHFHTVCAKLVGTQHAHDYQHQVNCQLSLQAVQDASAIL